MALLFVYFSPQVIWVPKAQLQYSKTCGYVLISGFKCRKVIPASCAFQVIFACCCTHQRRGGDVLIWHTFMFSHACSPTPCPPNSYSMKLSSAHAQPLSRMYTPHLNCKMNASCAFRLNGIWFERQHIKQ